MTRTRQPDPRPGLTASVAVRWTVKSGDGPRVRDVLDRAGADPDAVAEGRVFVGRRRVRAGDEAVAEGEVVEVSPRREATARVEILLDAHGLLAVAKPAGVPTIPDHAGSAHALIAIVARVLGVGVEALHPTSRLDRDVSGVVFFARTRGAAARLLRARDEGAYERRYLALAARAPEPPSGVWNVPIGRGRDPRLRAPNGRDAVPATTRYAVCGRAPRGESLLALAPGTGRTHQLRVHAAHAGAPLLGDRDYGGPARLTMSDGRVRALRRVALHAARVAVPDGEGGTLVAVAPVPAELVELWAALGGEPAAWEGCAACALDPSRSSP